jgi:hypothetical protein
MVGSSLRANRLRSLYLIALLVSALILSVAPTVAAAGEEVVEFHVSTSYSLRDGQVSPTELTFTRGDQAPPWEAPSEIQVFDEDERLLEDAIDPSSLTVDTDDPRELHVAVQIEFDEGWYEFVIVDGETLSYAWIELGRGGGDWLDVTPHQLPSGMQVPFPLTLERGTAWTAPEDIRLYDQDAYELIQGAFDVNGATIDDADPYALHVELLVELADGWYEIEVHEGGASIFGQFRVGAADGSDRFDLLPGWLDAGYDLPFTFEAWRDDRHWAGEVSAVVLGAEAGPLPGAVDPTSIEVDGYELAFDLVQALEPGGYTVVLSDDLGVASAHLHVDYPYDGTWVQLSPHLVARGEAVHVFEAQGYQTSWSETDTQVVIDGGEGPVSASVEVTSPTELSFTVDGPLQEEEYDVIITTGLSQQYAFFSVVDDLSTANYAITGTVSDDAGNPLEGICVGSYAWLETDGSGGWLERSTTTDADGSYELELSVDFTGSFDGGYVDVYAWDCASPDDHPRYGWAHENFHDLPQNETFHVDLAMERVGALTGTILDRGTGAAPDACVQVYQYQEGERTWASAKVVDGDFFLSGLAGESVLGIDACSSPDPEEEARYRREFPYDPQFLDGKSSYDEADRYAVPMGGPTDIGVFTLDRAAAPLGADLLSYHEGSGRWWQTTIVDGEAEQRLVTTYGTRSGWQTHLTADMTGDGYTEILSYHESSGRWWMTSVDVDGTATQTLLATYGTRSGWDAHLAADVTGDGSAELLSYHGRSGRWWMTSLDGATATQTLLTTYGTTGGWEAHLAADLTGDGRAELLSYHPSRGRWWMTTVEDGSATQSLLTTYGTRTGWQAHLAGVLPHRG